MKEKIFKKGFAKRLFSVVLAVAMVVALMPMNSLTVYADAEITWGDIKSTIVLPTGVTLPTVDDATTVTQVTSDLTTWSAGWYVVNSDVTIDGDITLPYSEVGVYLILADGCTLTVNGKMDGDGETLLYIYGQSEGSGRLSCSTTTGEALYVTGLNINGGNVEFTTQSTRDKAIDLQGMGSVNGGTLTATSKTEALYPSSIRVNKNAIVMAGDSAPGEQKTVRNDWTIDGISGKKYVKITVPAPAPSWVADIISKVDAASTTLVEEGYGGTETTLADSELSIGFANFCGQLLSPSYSVDGNVYTINGAERGTSTSYTFNVTLDEDGNVAKVEWIQLVSGIPFFTHTYAPKQSGVSLTATKVEFGTSMGDTPADWNYYLDITQTAGDGLPSVTQIKFNNCGFYDVLSMVDDESGIFNNETGELKDSGNLSNIDVDINNGATIVNPTNMKFTAAGYGAEWQPLTMEVEFSYNSEDYVLAYTAHKITYTQPKSSGSSEYETIDVDVFAPNVNTTKGVTTPGNAPSGKEFTGWTTTKNGTSGYSFGSPLTENIELYPIWGDHTHTWGYIADDNVITATCSKNSAHTATLTLTASSANYSGNTAEDAVTMGVISADELTTWTDVGAAAPTFAYYEADADNSTVRKNDTPVTSFVSGTNYVVEATIGEEKAVKAFRPIILPDGASWVDDTNTTWWKWDGVSKTITFGGEGEIPDYVSESDCPWYEYNHEFVNAVFEEGITKIGANCLSNADCYHMNIEHTLSLPNTLETIGEKAFLCVAFTNEIELTSVKNIGDKAFQQSSFPKITISGDGITIGKNAFAGNLKNKELTINGNNIVIDEEAFYNLQFLETLNISGNNIEIKSKALAAYMFLSKMVFNGDGYIFRDSALSGNESLNEIVFNGENTTIEGNLFGDGPKVEMLRKVEFKKNANSISDTAFTGVGPNLVFYVLQAEYMNKTAVEDFPYEDIKELYSEFLDAISTSDEEFYNFAGNNMDKLMAPYDSLVSLLLPANWNLNPMEGDGSFYGGVFKPLIIEHEHDWDFASEGNKIEAYCKNAGCPSGTDETHKTSITLNASGDKYSDSDAYTGASLDGLDEFIAATELEETPIIAYYKVNEKNATTGGKVVDKSTLRTSVGNYYATVTVGEATAVKAFKVEKLDGPAAPKNLAGVKPSVVGGTDGKITGVNATMEYSTDDGETWKAVEGTEIAGLEAGDVKVRVAETASTKVGEVATVTVPEGPEEEKKPEVEKVPAVTVSYQTHIQTYGDSQGYKKNGEVAGTTGESKRLEAIKIKVAGNSKVQVAYTTHVQTIGWLPWSNNNELNGTTGEARRMEAIKIQLKGADAGKYDVYYRVHSQTYGWLAWAKNGQPAGTTGLAKRLEGIQIVVVEKGKAVDKNLGGIKSTNDKAYIEGTTKTSDSEKYVNEVPNVLYKTHVQTFGWQNWKANGSVAGTTGLYKRIEGIQIKLTNCAYEGGIQYMTHVQTAGWDKKWNADGALAGTTGISKRLEGIRIELTGEMAKHYDVYYRVHSQTYGWLGWAKNGESAGSEGHKKRLEGIQIVLVEKGGKAPANNYGGVISKTSKSFIK